MLMALKRVLGRATQKLERRGVGHAAQHFAGGTKDTESEVETHKGDFKSACRTWPAKAARGSLTEVPSEEEASVEPPWTSRQRGPS